MKARIRTIKPEAAFDLDLWELGRETGLPIFQAFVILWCHADREGRFKWEPEVLRAKCLPYWDGDFSRVLDALVTRGHLVRYACLGRDFGVVRTFTTHQHINGREEASRLPEPPIESITSHVPDASIARESREVNVTIPSLPFVINKDLTKNAPPGALGNQQVAPLPPDWDPGAAVLAMTPAKPVDHQRYLARFRAHHCAGGEERTERRWRQAYVLWATKDAQSDRGRPRRGASPAQRQPDTGAMGDFSEYLAESATEGVLGESHSEPPGAPQKPATGATTGQEGGLL